MEMTRGQFIEEIKQLKEGITVNVSSSDIGNVTLYLRGCVIKASSEDGVDGEITIYKPNTDMEVSIDFDIVDEITKQDNIYTLSFRNGLSDVDIEVVQ
ncbi:MAG: hypothetical protein IJE43_01860 [Alphaproteobacteria bacterium]|nr:hypothetical protein [Alphaproteobacteria bacterium]MBQ3512528.1 hypothetical protein [Lachnospiraceae bacterium]